MLGFSGAFANNSIRFRLAGNAKRNTIRLELQIKNRASSECLTPKERPL